MEENKFEKQMQQKLDELKIQPSDDVWKKIETQIGGKKPAKRVLLFLVFIFLILLSGGFWFWNSGRQPVSMNHDLVKNKVQQNNNTANLKQNKNNFAKADSDLIVTKNNKHQNFTEKNGNKNFSKNSSNAIAHKINHKINSENSFTFFGDKKVNEPSTETVMHEPASNKQSENKIKEQLHDSIDKKINEDSLSKTLALNPATKNNDTSNKKQNNDAVVHQSKKNKWKFGILFSGGISNVGNNFSGTVNSSAYYSNPGVQNAGGGIIIYPSSSPKSHFGFITGIFAEKNISKKSLFILGVNYKSFNTSIHLYDSAGTFTARSSTDKYINHFNFIEVPLSFRTLIGKGLRLPFYWQGGIVFSELINTTALQYNPVTQYYYKDNSLFNKTQLGLNTGLFVEFFSKQKNSILFGPYFYYEATKVAGDGLYNKKHFVFTGLRTEIIFGK